MSGGYNRNRDSGGYGSKISSININRVAKGTRLEVTASDLGFDVDGDLEGHEKEYDRKLFIPQIVVDQSDPDDDDDDEDHDSDEKRDLVEPMNDDNAMDIDKEEEDDEDIGTEDHDPWSNDQDNYTPITLDTKPSYGKKGKFKQKEMFKIFKEKKDSHNNQFMFIQMPSVLPLVSQLNEDEKHDIKLRKRVQTSRLKQFGEGEIGKIRLRKSGKAEFVIGDYVMDINFASSMDCYQQVMHLHCEMNTEEDYNNQIKGKSQFLGNVPPQNNLVCSYQAKDLIL